MKHTASTLVILFFISLSYFILPHSLFPQNISASATKNTPNSKKEGLPTPTPTIMQRQLPTHNPLPTVTQTTIQSYQ